MMDDNLIDEIRAFSDLEPDWDGEDAEPIAPKAIDNCIEFLQNYKGTLNFEAFPNMDGSVGLQADFNTETDCVCVDFPGDGTVAYYVRHGEVIQKGSKVPLALLTGFFSRTP
jgi:hypothetical protein